MMTDRIGTLILRKVLSVGADGSAVVLEGSNARVLSAGALTPGDIGRRAVCQDADDAGAPVTMVLGLVGDDETGEDVPAGGPVVLQNGKARLALHADGHVQLEGEAVTVDSAGRLRMLAGRIDLN